MLTVLKFGGSSLADDRRMGRAAQRAVERAKAGEQVVVVVSAQGDTTEQLTGLAARVSGAPDRREMDALLSVGEQISAALMAMTIQALGVPAVSLTGWQAGVRTTGTHGDADVGFLDGHRIEKALDDGKIVVVTGFQGMDERGDVTTLGRGGSDTTAVALAAMLKADRCLIYTDVDGVYDKDPRLFPDARRYERIGYEEMLALARSGAQVLHTKAVELAMAYGVEIRVLSSFRTGPGTMVAELPIHKEYIPFEPE